MPDGNAKICPLMTTGFTYRRCMGDGCALWSSVFDNCAIVAIAEPWAMSEPDSEAEDSAKKR